MNLDAALLLDQVQALTDAESSPEARRAAAEAILSELMPHLVAALADKPVVAGLLTVGLDALDKAEDNFTVGEVTSILGSVAKVLALGRAKEDRPRVARPTLSLIHI